MKKTSTILACVIAAVIVIISICSGNTVTAEATDGVVAGSPAIVTTTEATTTEQESKVTVGSSNLRIKEVKPYKLYVKKKAKAHFLPKGKSKVIKTYSKGKKLTITAKCGDWRKVGKDKWVHKDNLSKKNPFKYYKGVRLEYSKTYNVTSNKLTRSRGVVHYNGHRETWYSTSEYGQTSTARHISGKHVADDGTIRDKDGYVCVATSQSYMKFGSRLMTSRGPAKVYDCGCAYGTVDIYTTW